MLAGLLAAVDTTEAATYGGLGGILALFGLLVRVYWRTDERWSRILDAQNTEHAQTIADRDYWRARAEAAQAEADKWRARYVACSQTRPT